MVVPTQKYFPDGVYNQKSLERETVVKITERKVISGRRNSMMWCRGHCGALTLDNRDSLLGSSGKQG